MEILKRLLHMGKQGNERIVIVSDDLKNAGVLLSLDEYEALTQNRTTVEDPLESPTPASSVQVSKPEHVKTNYEPALEGREPVLENKNDAQEIPIRVTVRNQQNLGNSTIPSQQNVKFPVKYEEEERFYLDQ